MVGWRESEFDQIIRFAVHKSLIKRNFMVGKKLPTCLYFNNKNGISSSGFSRNSWVPIVGRSFPPRSMASSCNDCVTVSL